MTCEGCARRRKELALMSEAARLWTQNPFGPSVTEIAKRLREEQGEES